MIQTDLDVRTRLLRDRTDDLGKLLEELRAVVLVDRDETLHQLRENAVLRRRQVEDQRRLHERNHLHGGAETLRHQRYVREGSKTHRCVAH